MSLIETSDVTIVRGACPHDCPDTCAMQVTVVDGCAVKEQGDPDHPTTQGALCAKVNDYQTRTYASDRLLHPLRRTGPKGEGKHEGKRTAQHGYPQLELKAKDRNDFPARHTSPIPLAALQKFDTLKGVTRIYDSGDIVIYDMRGLVNAIP